MMKTILAMLAAAAVVIGAMPEAEAGPRFSISFSSGSNCRSYTPSHHYHYQPHVYRAPVRVVPRYYAPPTRCYTPPVRCYTPPPRCYTPPVRCYTPPVRYYVPRCR